MTAGGKRQHQRQRTLKAGKIVLKAGGVIDCTVRNMSAAGACLVVSSPVGIPDEFVLQNNDAQRLCRTVWRSEKKIGVAFI